MIKRVSKQIVAFSIAFIMILNCIMPTQAATGDTSPVGALADTYSVQEGVYTLSASSRIFVVGNSVPTGELLQTAKLIQSQIAADKNLNVGMLELVWGPIDYAWTGDIVLNLSTAAGIAAEGYELNVSNTAKITASDVDGLLYGANMLQKYFRNAKSLTLSGFQASDVPDTKERTVMLDCARKYYTAEWICNFIRQMSWMGYNAIELHFSEDGGFRADFWDPAYYKGSFQPENDFSWLCGSHVQSWVKDPYRNDPDAGKYLTTKELVQILEVAKEYHMDVIPSFDSPAHMDYLSWKFEQNYKSNKSYSFTYNGTTYKASSTQGCINYTGKKGASTPTWPYYTTIDITDGTMAKAFVFALYEDIADFFKEYAGSTDFSIGADEVNLSSGYGIKWSYAAFPGYVNELNRMLNAKGYTCRMFNDFIGSTTYNQDSNAKAIYDFDDNIEIMYWNSDFNPTTGKYDEPIWHVKFFWENNTGSTDNWGDGGRTIYNCIQTNCYYVLRVAASNTSYPNMDARNPKNYNWTFYHSTEESIYNEWYPADISEKGLYTEDAADAPANQLGGAYFLIWNDYAALNTEAEVWNGVNDNTGTSSNFYSLFNRMWSNIIKMWNSDINNSLSYSQYAAIRDTFGYFPGYTSCSADANLPAAKAPTQAYRADHTALTEALKNKISNADGIYTEVSYAAYEKAYEKAVTVNADYAAAAEELASQITALENAKKALVLAGNSLMIECKTMVGEKEILITEIEVPASQMEYMFFLEPLTGYTYKSVECAKFIPLSSKDGSGFLAGLPNSGTVTVWYENTPDVTRLNDLIMEAEDSGAYEYDAESWQVYEEVLNNAKNFSINPETTQDSINTLVKALEKARAGLTVSGKNGTKVIAVEMLSETARLGKQVGLKITTTPDVDSITIDGEELIVCTGKIQELKDKGLVKVWYVTFAADEIGTFEYTINAGSASKTLEITVQ